MAIRPEVLFLYTENSRRTQMRCAIFAIRSAVMPVSL